MHPQVLKVIKLPGGFNIQSPPRQLLVGAQPTTCRASCCLLRMPHPLPSPRAAPGAAPSVCSAQKSRRCERCTLHACSVQAAAIRTLSVGTIALDLLLHGVDAGLAIALDAETPSLTRLLGTLEAGAASGILGTTLTSNTNLTGTLSLADPGHVRLAATLSHLESLSTLLPDLLDTLVP